MNNKIVVLLSTIFPAKQANVTCRPAVIQTLGTQITKQPERAPDDWSFMWEGF